MIYKIKPTQLFKGDNVTQTGLVCWPTRARALSPGGVTKTSSPCMQALSGRLFVWPGDPESSLVGWWMCIVLCRHDYCGCSCHLAFEADAFLQFRVGRSSLCQLESTGDSWQTVECSLARWIWSNYPLRDHVITVVFQHLLSSTCSFILCFLPCFFFINQNVGSRPVHCVTISLKLKEPCNFSFNVSPF